MVADTEVATGSKTLQVMIYAEHRVYRCVVMVTDATPPTPKLTDH